MIELHFRGMSQLLICGQALSHSVSATLKDIIRDWRERRRDLKDIYLLYDGI
jgi:nicotinamidase-related amidase